MGKTKRQTQSGSRGVDWFPTGLFTQRGCSSIAGSCASGKSGRQNTHHKSIGLNVCEQRQQEENARSVGCLCV